MLSDQTAAGDFSQFVAANERRLRQALTAWLGPDLGRDAAAEALAHAWEHWERIGAMDNPPGYLYRLALNWGRKQVRRREIVLPEVAAESPEWIEPGLPHALAALSEKQRVAILLVHGHGWSLGAVAEMLGVSKGTIQTHMDRGMKRLRHQLKVDA